MILMGVSADDCPSIRLIQPLDEQLTGLSYIIVAGGKHYMVRMDGNDSAVEQLDLPKGFDNSEGIMVYFNRWCSPPAYYLTVYKV